MTTRCLMFQIHKHLWFSVDATQAGAGNLEVIVRCARDGTRIPNFLEAADRSGKFRIYFTPRPNCHNYVVDVTFNEEQVSGGWNWLIVSSWQLYV